MCVSGVPGIGNALNCSLSPLRQGTHTRLGVDLISTGHGKGGDIYQREIFLAGRRSRRRGGSHSLPFFSFFVLSLSDGGSAAPKAAGVITDNLARLYLRRRGESCSNFFSCSPGLRERREEKSGGRRRRGAVKSIFSAARHYTSISGWGDLMPETRSKMPKKGLMRLWSTVRPQAGTN